MKKWSNNRWRSRKKEKKIGPIDLGQSLLEDHDYHVGNWSHTGLNKIQERLLKRLMSIDRHDSQA